MSKKEAIIDELLTRARIYVGEQVEMIIDTVQKYDEVPESCSRCGRIMDEIYLRPEELITGWNDYDLYVSKCETCDVYFAFWIPPFTYDESCLIPAMEDEHMGGRAMEPSQWKYAGNPRWGEGKQPRFPRESAKVYERAISKQDNFRMRLDKVIQDKFAEMRNAGLSNKTIHSARNAVLTLFRDNSFTEKQLVAIFAATIYDTSHKDVLVGVPERLKRVGERLPERQLEKLFGVTRKTIRKWRKRFPRRVDNSTMMG